MTPSRRPRARLRPEALAAARGGAREGLDWLGHPPDAKPGLWYRALRLFARFLLFGVFRFRIETSGRELLPKGGYFLVGAKDLDEAIDIAARIPAGRWGTVEIRPVVEVPGLPT